MKATPLLLRMLLVGGVADILLCLLFLGNYYIFHNLVTAIVFCKNHCIFVILFTLT